MARKPFLWTCIGMGLFGIYFSISGWLNQEPAPSYSSSGNLGWTIPVFQGAIGEPSKPFHFAMLTVGVSLTLFGIYRLTRRPE